MTLQSSGNGLHTLMDHAGRREVGYGVDSGRGGGMRDRKAGGGGLPQRKTTDNTRLNTGSYTKSRQNTDFMQDEVTLTEAADKRSLREGFPLQPIPT